MGNFKLYGIKSGFTEPFTLLAVNKIIYSPLDAITACMHGCLGLDWED